MALIETTRARNTYKNMEYIFDIYNINRNICTEDRPKFILNIFMDLFYCLTCLELCHILE